MFGRETLGRLAVLVLVLAGGLAALTETRSPTIIGYVSPYLNGGHLGLGLLIFALALYVAKRGWVLPWRVPATVILLAFFGSLLAGWIGGVAWPNSGDEYSYVYLAETFAAGRTWNLSPPDGPLFEMYHVLVKDGRLFSPYPPGWSAYLMSFQALGLVWLANPVAAGLNGFALWGLARRVGLDVKAQNASLALALLTPFALFLGGSLFPHVFVAAAVVGIVWAQLADERSPAIWRKLLIGGLFGIVMVTRHEVFIIVAAIYTVDRMWFRRLEVFSDAFIVLLGVLPFAVSLGFYNASVTGSWMALPATWAVPLADIPPDRDIAQGLFMRLARRNLYWLGSMSQFGALPIILLSFVAVGVKIVRRSCRYYDFLLPATVVFYAFLPFTGGHQYGPRYWFFACPLAVITIATGLLGDDGYLRFGKWRVAFEGFVAASLLYATAAFAGLLITTHAYINARRAIYNVAPPSARSVVLVPNRELVIWPWEGAHAVTDALDFTRNDIAFSGPVLYGRGSLDDSVARACALPRRDVFRWEPPGQLVRMTCP